VAVSGNKNNNRYIEMSRYETLQDDVLGIIESIEPQISGTTSEKLKSLVLDDGEYKIALNQLTQMLMDGAIQVEQTLMKQLQLCMDQLQMPHKEWTSIRQSISAA
jgi:hypothetical protein